LFQRAIVNLISNAIRYTPQGGSIRIAYRVEADGVEIQIRDTGSGIPAKDLPFIFERFYRVDPSRNLGSGGVGLGLAIVKSIVDMHAGRIGVESEPGQETRFVMWLPQSTE